MRFTSALIQSSFAKLRQSIVEGKTGIERTSALMYFLAYDCTARNHYPLSLNPDTAVGKQNRDALTREYCKLVTVRVLGLGQLWSVSDLGLVTLNGTDPAKRISSNFLTVPLKKASQGTSPMNYPNRPKPLLRLGNGLGVGNWGIASHPHWNKNLPIFLSGRITKWPFTDLAIFVLRDSEFTNISSLRGTLEYLIEDRFSLPLADYWKMQIAIEFDRKGFKPLEQWSASEYHAAFEDDQWMKSIGVEDHVVALNERVTSLEHRIYYLEHLLRKHKIPFEME
jgi:hypothetical protein